MIRTLAAALGTTTCLVALATPAAAQTREFNIPARSLRIALDTFARQSGRQVIYRGDEVRSTRSPGVSGARTAEEALNAILAGTGFRAQKDPSGAFAVAKVGNAPATAEALSSLGTDANEIVVTGVHDRDGGPFDCDFLEARRHGEPRFDLRPLLLEDGIDPRRDRLLCLAALLAGIGE